MKNLKRVLAWALLSLSLQGLGLFALEQILFKHSSDFTMEKVESKPVEANVVLEESDENVSVSFSGKFLSYNRNGGLYVVGAKDGTATEVKLEGCEEILHHTWIEGNNRLFIVYKNKENMVALSSYDATTNSEYKILNLTRYSNNMEVDDITISQKPGVKYISLSSNSSKVPVIYRIDINETVTRVNHSIRSLGEMIALQNKDVLIAYDDVRKAYYSITNGRSKKINFSIQGKSELLGVDTNENVYFAAYDGDKISKIYYGGLGTRTGEWKVIELDSLKEKKDIYVTYEGNVLVNDNLMGCVTNLNNGDKVSYEGKFESMNNKIIYSQVENKVYIKQLKDVDKIEETEEAQ